MNTIHRCALGGLLLSATLTLSSPVLAQAGACGEERDVSTGTLAEQTWKRMNQAYELVGEEQYDEALQIMQQVRSRARENDSYLRAVVAQAVAQVYWSKGEYDKSLEEFELAVELDALPDRQHYALMYQIAQLYYGKERYDEALDRLALWFCKVPEEQHTASAYVLRASIYANKEDWNQVIPAIEKAISMEENPKENWYALKLAAHYQLEQFPQAADTLEDMITLWPDKKTYWTQLSNTYYKLEQEDEALSTSALAYRKGLLDKQEDLIYLANLYSMKDVPYKAAQVLQKGLDDGIIENEEKYWTMTGDSWYAAEEYDEALAAFERSGQVADEGKIDMRRAYILIDMERWDEASEALRAALDKGGLKDRQTGEAYLMLGMSEFNRGNFDQASTAWGRASRFDSARAQAQQWMTHMKEERARRAAS